MNNRFRRGRSPMNQGKPTLLLPILILGFGTYHYFGEEKSLDNIKSMVIEKTTKAEPKKEIVEAKQAEKKEVLPTKQVEKKEIVSVKILVDVNGYSDKKAQKSIGTIQQGLEYKVIGLHSTNGSVYSVKVRSNGLSLWIKNTNAIKLVLG